ncbi:MAG: FemAB family PEP-CTERM system-associated protein [Rhodospirillaceae bacterium]|nr:FemAB family PEP-CTERM system-associated protein [Rhodospirillales bacterium]
MKIKELGHDSVAAWDSFVAQCPDASFFHRAGWGRVIQAAYGQKPHYLFAERDGAVVGVLPLIHLKSPLFGNRLVSTAFTIGGGIAAVDEEARIALDNAAMDVLKSSGADYLEYRQPARCHGEGEGWAARSDLYGTFERPIAGDEGECLKQIPRKQRAVVRKALEGTLVDEVDSTPERFFQLYAFSMRNMGTPVFGARFFRLLMAEFAGDADCLTVLHDGVPVASVLSFYFRDRVMPYYTGCAPQARDLGANDFMYWRLMRRAHDRGFGVFDFGRSKVGTGPYSFKKNWGFTPAPVTHEYRMAQGGTVPEINPLNPKYKAFIAVWKRLPLGLANVFGPMVVRHIG